MQIVHLQDARLLVWANERLGQSFHPSQCRWVAGLVDGGIDWVAVFSHFSNTNCTLSIATAGSKRWASRAMFRAVFAFPFLQWNLLRVTMIVDERNEVSLKMLRRQGRFTIGGREEGRMRDLFAEGVDGIVFGLLKKECAWI